MFEADTALTWKGTPLPLAGEGPGVRAFAADRGRPFAVCERSQFVMVVLRADEPKFTLKRAHQIATDWYFARSVPAGMS